MSTNLSIIGTSITKFGELWEKSLVELMTEAVTEAVRDAGVDPEDIEAIFVANKAAGSFENQLHLNALASQLFPHFPPAVHIEAACASGGAALLAAEHALLAGQYKTVLVVGAEKMTDVSAEETTEILASAADATRQFGSTFPALYALVADMYLRKHALTSEVLATIAVKNHRHALKNPKAQFRKELSLEQVMQSAIIAPPLRVFDCSPISDGAAAVVLTTQPHKAKARVVGAGQGQDAMVLADRRSLTTFRATSTAAKQAYQRAGRKPADIQCAEVHDCFTIAELLAIADLGFFPEEEAGRATLQNQTTLGGKIVINPSGGLKACGHPVGATGVKQVAYLAELVSRGEADRVLAHNVGGAGGTAVVHILEKAL